MCQFMAWPYQRNAFHFFYFLINFKLAKGWMNFHFEHMHAGWLLGWNGWVVILFFVLKGSLRGCCSYSIRLQPERKHNSMKRMKKNFKRKAKTIKFMSFCTDSCIKKKQGSRNEQKRPSFWRSFAICSNYQGRQKAISSFYKEKSVKCTKQVNEPSITKNNCLKSKKKYK